MGLISLIGPILFAVTVTPPADGADCTAAVQKLIDAEIAAATPERPGVIEFSPGVYPLSALFVRTSSLHPLSRIEGKGATPTLKLLSNQKTFTRILGVEWHADTDSPTLVIRGLSFDLSMSAQSAWDGSYNLEHQAGILLSGQNPNTPKKGRLRFVLENCHFANSCGDGATFYKNLIGTVVNCTATDCFRSGFHFAASETDVLCHHVSTSSPNIVTGGRTSIQSEPGGNSRQSLTFVECRPTVFDFALPHPDSRVSLDRCTTSLACNVANNGTFRASRSTFNGGVYFTLVGDSNLDECTLVATDGKPFKDAYLPLCCLWAQWHLPIRSTNQTLRLDRCVLRPAENLDKPAIGMRINTFAPKANNLVEVSGCEARGLSTFMHMERMGSRWIVRNTLIDCPTAFRLIATPALPYDLTLIGNRLGPSVATYINTTYDLRENRMKHVESSIPAKQNVFRSTAPINRVGLNKYEGGRLIVGDAPGLPEKTPGLPGDVFQDSDAARWRVKTPSYSAAVWEEVP